MRADNRPFESSLYDKMNCVHRLDVFIPKLKCYTLHISCFHNTKVQMFLLAVFITRPKQGLWWDHCAGTFLGFLNVSLRAFGAQLRLDRPCKSNWPLLIKKCHVTSRTGGSNWPFRFWNVHFHYLINDQLLQLPFIWFPKENLHCTNAHKFKYVTSMLFNIQCY